MNRWVKRSLVVAGLVAAVAAGHSFDPTTKVVVEHNGYSACKAEDSTNCYWNAAKQGNGQGRSFIDVNGTNFYTD